MHDAAYQFASRFGTDDKVDVLDIGGRDVNGTCRPLFPNANYLAVDLRDGPGVDIVADVCEWTTRKRFDVVVCTEVLEHTPHWSQLVAAASRFLRRNGRVVITCAGPGRAPHSAEDGGAVRAGEHYSNLEPGELDDALRGVGLVNVEVAHVGEDLQATAVKK